MSDEPTVQYNDPLGRFSYPVSAQQDRANKEKVRTDLYTGRRLAWLVRRYFLSQDEAQDMLGEPYADLALENELRKVADRLLDGAEPE